MNEDKSAAINRLCHKALNFDLVIAKLKQHYTNGHHTKAYKEIQTFMARNGFSHRQGSGYRSDTPLLDVDVLDIVEKLYIQFPWFVQCVNKFDVTDVGDVYDLAELFEEYDTTPSPKRQPQPKSVLARLEQAKEQVQNTPAWKDGQKKRTNDMEK